MPVFLILLPPAINDSVELNLSKCVEYPIEGIISYTPLPHHDSTLPLFCASLSTRFNYVVPGVTAICAFDSPSIFVFNLYLGSGREFLPTEPEKISKIWLFIYLTHTRGFLVYETPSKHQRASIILIDYDRGTFSLFGDAHEIKTAGIYCYSVIRESEPMIIIKNSSLQIRVFDLDSNTFELKSQRTIDVHQYAFLFGFVDGKIIFITTMQNNCKVLAFGNFILVGNDKLPLEIEDTAVYINLQKSELEKTSVGRPNIESCWHGRKAFVFVNVIRGKKFNDVFLHPSRSNPIILTFDYDTIQWTELITELPSNRVYYQFHVDDDALLTVVTYSKVDANLDETCQLRSSLVRIPLKKADTLFNLCWFVMRGRGLASQFEQIL